MPEAGHPDLVTVPRNTNTQHTSKTTCVDQAVRLVRAGVESQRCRAFHGVDISPECVLAPSQNQVLEPGDLWADMHVYRDSRNSTSGRRAEDAREGTADPVSDQGLSRMNWSLRRRRKPNAGRPFRRCSK